MGLQRKHVLGFRSHASRDPEKKDGAQECLLLSLYRRIYISSLPLQSPFSPAIQCRLLIPYLSPHSRGERKPCPQGLILSPRTQSTHHAANESTRRDTHLEEHRGAVSLEDFERLSKQRNAMRRVIGAGTCRVCSIVVTQSRGEGV